MKKNIVILLAVALIAALGVSAYAANSSGETSEVTSWGEVYYEDFDESSEGQMRIIDSGKIIAGGVSKVELSQVAQIFELSYNTITEKGITDFASAIKNGGKMRDMVEETNVFLASTAAQDTVVMEMTDAGLETQVVIKNDNGTTFKLNSSIERQINATKLTPNLDPNTICVGIPAMGTAILFSGGDMEYIAFTASRFDDIIKLGTVYEVRELAAIMDQNKKLIALPEMDLSESTEISTEPSALAENAQSAMLVEGNPITD